MNPFHLLFCQQPNHYADEPLLMEGYRMIDLDNTVRRSLSDVGINTASFCATSASINVACAKQLGKLQWKLNEFNAHLPTLT